MKIPNSDFEIRPSLSSFNFYISQTGMKEDNPLKDFNRLKNGSELGIRFTLSGLNELDIPGEKNDILVNIISYDKVGQVGNSVNNIWTINIEASEMKESYKDFQFTLYKVYTDIAMEDIRTYDMTHTFRMLKIFVTDTKFNVELLSEEDLSSIMTETHLNELLCTKIPMIPKSKEV
ncbi:hypothetical protein [Mammaliicoccus fleurettii]|uniref:hypothetical protein n=1 Tax=Mammaliicoccus fleurettii TaxID=150056 RepID=UPI000992C675|nr:hypothetical protein [Mammaliicoccus fleurettii]OOV78856.1 hypothetical protein B2G86_00590 [Mammaliicoccus fleurettii]